MIKAKCLILGAFIITLMACAESNTEKLHYSNTHSYGSTFALQFVSKTDDVSVAFNLQSKEISVKGFKQEYSIKFSDVTSINFQASGDEGMLVIQTLEKSNEIGIINKVDFNVFAKEMKSSIPSIKLESL
jgi:hypothetical protein